MKRSSVVLSISALALTLLIAGFTQQGKTQKKAVPEPAAAEKIKWYSMTEGYAKAKKEKKMLLVDVYTDWCYWCKVMDQKTYSQDIIIKKVNEYFVAVKFNPEVNGTHVINNDSLNSEQLGRYLNQGGRIPGYPMTYIWKDINNQKTINPYSGYIETDPFNTILNQFIGSEQ